jgi:hypothetical protein
MTTPVPWSMKKRSPICAPGWMSIPVLLCANSEMMRDHRHLAVEHVGDAVGGDGFDGGVAGTPPPRRSSPPDRRADSPERLIRCPAEQEVLVVDHGQWSRIGSWKARC